MVNSGRDTVASKVGYATRLTAIAAVFSVAACVIVRDWDHVAWRIVTLGLILGMAWLVHIARASRRRHISLLITLYAAGLVLATLVDGYLHQFYAGYRVRLDFVSPNTLGASIAMAVVAAIVTGDRKVGIALAVLALPATLLTGSRTAAVALLIAAPLAASSVNRRWLVRTAAVEVGVALLLVLGTSALPRSLGRTAPATVGRNLLQESGDLTHPVWILGGGANVEGKHEHGPVASNGRGADIVWLLSQKTGVRGPSAAIAQYLRPSSPGVRYVGSVYLRASMPEEVILNSGLSQTRCMASPVWSRCVTPPWLGDGHTQARIQILRARSDRPFAVELWGPQVERGTHATTYDNTTTSWFHSVARELAVGRFDFNRWRSSPSAVSRLWTFRRALAIFREHPIAGAGMGKFYSLSQGVLTEGPPARDRHAHDLILQVLVGGGLLGLAGLLIPLAGYPARFWRGYWKRLLPLLCVVAILNLGDYTYFSGGVYYAFWFGVFLVTDI